MPDQKPSLLMIGHMYATAFNRRKLNPLADYFEVTCVTWPLNGGMLFGKPLSDFEQVDHDPRYDLHRLAIWPTDSGHTRYFHHRLGEVMRARRFDLILVDSEPWSYIRWQTWLLARLIQPHARIGEFSWENVERPGLKGLLLSLVYRIAVRTHDFSISGNQACRKIFLRYGALAETNLVAAQLGVESQEFRPAGQDEKAQLRRELGLPEKGFMIGYCGRWTDSKGLPELLSAVAAIRGVKPDLNLQLAMLGSGDMENELRGFRENNPWLHLLLPRPHREVAAFMRSLDMFVLASKPVPSGPGIWEEQFGHVLIEAMAAGVPTLGSSSGAIPEVIGMEEAIFRHSDATALRELMLYWLDDMKSLSELAVRQRQRTLNHFSHESLAVTWADFLCAMLFRPRR
jgi:glycosyltransferase involved in cell wall biosynthesis